MPLWVWGLWQRKDKENKRGEVLEKEWENEREREREKKKRKEEEQDGETAWGYHQRKHSVFSYVFGSG